MRRHAQRHIHVAAALLAVCGGLVPRPANAEESATFFLERIAKGDEEARVFVLGIDNGISWMNGLDGKYVYCKPATLALTQDEIIAVLREFTLSHPKVATYPVGLVMLTALRHRFPCPPAGAKAGQ